MFINVYIVQCIWNPCPHRCNRAAASDVNREEEEELPHPELYLIGELRALIDPS